MASAIHSTLPLVTTTRIDVSQGKMSVQDFLRGLKRPASKARTANVHLITGNQDGPRSATLGNDDLTNRKPLAEDQSTSTPITRVEASNPSRPHLHERSPTKPPENDASQSFCSSPPAKSAGPTNQLGATGPTQSLDATKVLRNDERKSKPELPLKKDLPESSPLFCTPSSAANQGQIPGNLEAASKVQELENLSDYGLQNDQQRALRAVAPTVGAVVKEPDKKRRKRRRAPVNELALVAQLPYTDSPGNESSEQGRVKHKGSNEANIGRPMTKYGRNLVIPRRNGIDPQDFKFPPVTPRVVRSSGWTPGSGFEGTSLQTLGPTTLTSHKRPARRAKAVRYAVPALRPLDLSTEISPTAKASDSLLVQRTPESLALPPDTTRRVRSPNRSQDPSADYGGPVPHIDKATPADRTMSSQVQMLTALQRPRAKGTQLAEFKIFEDDDSARSHSPRCRKCPSPQERGVYSPAIRRPSRSERNGWLKRRSRASFADENEQLFEAHNATWYGNDAITNPCIQGSMQGRGRPTSMVRSAQFQAIKSSQSLEVHNSQGQPDGESPELGNYPIYPIQDAGLDVGKYFSNAVQNLSSKGKGAHTVVRRKSQIQKLGYIHQSEVEATLELGVTPRLKRTLSSVPFRPPFRNL